MAKPPPMGPIVDPGPPLRERLAQLRDSLHGLIQKVGLGRPDDVDRWRSTHATMVAAIAALQSKAPADWPSIPNEDLIAILGRPNFQCHRLANVLRTAKSWAIAEKAEAEQAAVIFWLLGIWFEHREKWKDAAAAEIDGYAAKVIADAKARKESANASPP